MEKKAALPLIVYQDDLLIVVNKPCGLTVNRSQTTSSIETLQDWIENNFQFTNSNYQNETDSEFIRRSGIVHRLDKDTSGLLIIAKNPQVLSKLLAQFKLHQVEKTYLAIVWGKLTGRGEINVPISRSPFNRKKFGVFTRGKEALTKYTALESAEVFKEVLTLCRVYPLTGRTHQIRIHLNYTGHPIVGDILYSGRSKGRWGLAHFNRMMLHALEISFLDPVTGKRRHYRSDIPEEFTIPAWKLAI